MVLKDSTERRIWGWGLETGAGDTPRAENGLQSSPLVLSEKGSRHGLGVKTEIVLPMAAEWRAWRQTGALEIPSAKALSLLLVLKEKVVDSGTPGG